jgi:hypothetical protein
MGYLIVGVPRVPAVPEAGALDLMEWHARHGWHAL